MGDSVKWYVVHTYSGYENMVKTAIEKSRVVRRMEELILEVSIPTEMVTEKVGSETKTVERKVFPGYVLVKMIMTDDSWHLVRNTRGVTGFIGSSTGPVPLTDEEIVVMGVDKHEIILDYQAGDRVKVTDGPLAGFEGVVEEIDAERNVARVVVSMFGRETPVDLTFDQVESVV